MRGRIDLRIISDPDGHAITQFIFKNLSYDPLRDFTPIRRMVTLELCIFALPDFTVRDVREFITASRQPGVNIMYGRCLRQAVRVRNRNLRQPGQDHGDQTGLGRTRARQGTCEYTTRAAADTRPHFRETSKVLQRKAAQGCRFSLT